VIVDRVRECAAANARRVVLPVQRIVVHHTSLSKAGTDNPTSIPDEQLDGVALARRFAERPQPPPQGLGTMGLCPYHLLIRRDPEATCEQLLPLTVAAAHAFSWNRTTWAVAYVGEHGPTPAQYARLVRACRALVMLSGGAAIARHDELDGGSRPGWLCPAPSISVRALSEAVLSRLPEGWRSWDAHARQTQAMAEGLTIDAAEAA
jgi:hypothetical protein